MVAAGVMTDVDGPDALWCSPSIMLQRSGRTAGLIEPCLPSPAKAPPSGPDWLHEIKHDGFRMRDGAGVRLYTTTATISASASP
jgi:hypothetical protein